MTPFTLDLPDELAARLAELPKSEVNRFAVIALTDLVNGTSHIHEDDPALDVYPELDDETIAAIEEALNDVEAGRTIPFEQVRAEWEAEKAARHATREQPSPAAATA